MDAEVDDGQDHHCVEEVHYTDEGLVEDAADCFWIADCEDVDEVIDLYGLHCQVEGEEHECWCKVDEEITKIKVENLHLKKEICDCHCFTC